MGVFRPITLKQLERIVRGDPTASTLHQQVYGLSRLSAAGWRAFEQAKARGWLVVSSRNQGVAGPRLYTAWDVYCRISERARVSLETNVAAPAVALRADAPPLQEFTEAGIVALAQLLRPVVAKRTPLTVISLGLSAILPDLETGERVAPLLIETMTQHLQPLNSDPPVWIKATRTTIQRRVLRAT